MRAIFMSLFTLFKINERSDSNRLDIIEVLSGGEGTQRADEC